MKAGCSSPQRVLTRLQKRKLESVAEQLICNEDVSSWKKERFLLCEEDSSSWKDEDVSAPSAQGKTSLTQLFPLSTPASLPSVNRVVKETAPKPHTQEVGIAPLGKDAKRFITGRHRSGFRKSATSGSVITRMMTDGSVKEVNGNGVKLEDCDCTPTIIEERRQVADVFPLLSSEASAVSSDGSDLQSEDWDSSYGDSHYLRMKLKEGLSRKSWTSVKLTQKDIESHHRKMMVNWLVEFIDEYYFRQETLFLGVAIMDAYLCKAPLVKKGSLQLLGVACIILAVKFEECRPPKMVQECLNAADRSFSAAQLLDMESTVLNTLGFDLFMPTTIGFVHHYLKKASDSCPKMAKMAEFLAHLSLLDADCLKFKPSVLASSAVLLARGIFFSEDPWPADLQADSGYSGPELKESVERLHFLQCQAQRSRHDSRAVILKFESTSQLEVSAIGAASKLPSCLYTN